MSNFAERLVARSAGRAVDAGVPLLVPRPAAWFEPTGGLGAPGEALLKDTGTASSGLAGTLPDDADSRAEGHVRDADASIDRTGRPGPATQPVVATGDAFSYPSPPGHTSSNRGRGAIPLSLASAAPSPRGVGEPAAIPEVRRQLGDRDTKPNVQPEPPPLTRVVVASGEPATAPTLLDAMAPYAPPVPAAEQGVPTISIGKIEVQFLPKETPPIHLNAQPQRTRGFHTYERARRGLR